MVTCPTCRDTGRVRLVSDSGTWEPVLGDTDPCPDCLRGNPKVRECDVCGEHAYLFGDSEPDGCIHCGALCCAGCGEDFDTAAIVLTVDRDERYCAPCAEREMRRDTEPAPPPVSVRPWRLRLIESRRGVDLWEEYDPDFDEITLTVCDGAEIAFAVGFDVHAEGEVREIYRSARSALRGAA